MSVWIVVPNWERFQHYKDRNPTWIKDYTELTDKDEYLALPLATRGVLHGIWLEYAKSHRRLSGDTARLSRRLGQRVLKAQVEALVHAGFIELRASKSVPNPYQSASAEKEEDREVLKAVSPQENGRNGPGFEEAKEQLLRVVTNG